MIRHSGVWRPGDRVDALYRTLPFDVPAHTAAVSIALRYPRGAGVLDLGLFDPDGFRGYSGGARDHVTITEHAATPGYLPGPVPAGRWGLLLGLYDIPDPGLPWEVEIEFKAWPLPSAGRPPLPQRRPARDLPHPGPERWLATDLHAHTVHSDGGLTVAELAARARGRGLDAVAVTDHNTVSHHRELAAATAWAGVALLPGQEVTTPTGHANVHGPVPWIDFREAPDRWAATTRAHGGLFAICHPIAGPWRWQPTLERPADLVEVWHPTWDRSTTDALDWWDRHGGGHAVGGGDFHRPGQGADLGAPTTWVLADGDDIAAGLAAGRVAISASPGAPVLLREGDHLHADAAEGTVIVDGDGRPTAVGAGRVTVPAGPGPHRLLDGTGTTIALCP